MKTEVINWKTPQTFGKMTIMYFYNGCLKNIIDYIYGFGITATNQT